MRLELEEGSIVTYELEVGDASNTYILDKLEDEHHALLRHPLSDICLMRVPIEKLNKVAPQIKDSSERSLDFCKRNSDLLDKEDRAEILALGVYFIYYRRMTPKQKKSLSDICGKLAEAKMGGDVFKAIALIKSNEAVLDDFNLMWYNNFRKIFKGEQNITSKAQRNSVFNMAGFVMAELQNPTASR